MGTTELEEDNGQLRKEKSYRFEIWVGLLLVSLVFSLIGNLFGIVSIKIAKCKEKYHFQRCWNSSTIFFFNLLVVDFCYCLFLMVHLIYASFLFLKILDRGGNEMVCRCFVLGTQTLGNIGGWSVMSIVLTQAIPKIR